MSNKRTKTNLPSSRLAPCPATKQRGASLVVSLIILMVLTLIGVTAMQTTTMEEKMTGQLRNRELAFQAAEAALRGGESIVQKIVAGTIAHDFGEDGETEYESSYATSLSHVSANPEIVIDAVPAPPGDSLQAGVIPENEFYYRITVTATGASDSAQVVLQSTFRP